MATDTVLVQIVTAANMAGVKQAQAGFLGMHKSTLALAGALTVLVAGGKSMLDNWQELEVAHKGLAQALHGDTKAAEKYQVTFDKWVDKNKRFVKSQSDAEEGLAKFVRAGNNEKDSMDLLNLALDMSVIKHESVSDASTQIIRVFAGNVKALKEVGITTQQYNKIMKGHGTDVQKHAALLTLMNDKYKDGKKAQDDSAQSANELNNKWMELSKKGGPVLDKALTTIIDGLNAAYDWFDRIGKDDSLWAAISGRLAGLSDAIHNLFIVPIIRAYNLLAKIAGWTQLSEESPAQAAKAMALAQSGTHGGFKGGKAGGGSVMAGSSYLVGERGPELLRMGSQSGTIVPNGAGGGNHIHVHIDRGAFVDGPAIDMLTNKIAQRLRMVRGY